MDSLYACQGNGPFSPYSDDLIKDFNTICGGPDPVAVDTICEALMDWDYPGTNVPSTVLGASEGLGTNLMDEIEIAGVPHRPRQATLPAPEHDAAGTIQPNVNVIMGSTCEAGCKAIVRIQLDQLKADGTLGRLKRPLYVFTGLQFEQIQPVDGDVIVVGDCAKPVLDRFPGREILGRVRRVSELHADLGQSPGRRNRQLCASSRRRSGSQHRLTTARPQNPADLSCHRCSCPRARARFSDLQNS